MNADERLDHAPENADHFTGPPPALDPDETRGPRRPGEAGEANTPDSINGTAVAERDVARRSVEPPRRRT